MATVWWNDGTSSYTSTSTAMTWAQWTESTAATTTSIGTTWTFWVGQQAGSYGQQGLVETPEQAAERERLNQCYREQQAATAEARKAAVERARKLLVENLSAAQREEFERTGHFVVHGRQARYRVRQGRSGNIDVVDRKGFLSHRLCAHPGEYVPDFDTMLAQKLLLENDEDYFLGRANRHTAGHVRGEAILQPLN